MTKTAPAPIHLLVRGALAGALLGFVTSLAFLVLAQTGKFVVGGLLFRAGFVLITVFPSSC